MGEAKVISVGKDWGIPIEPMMVFEKPKEEKEEEPL